MKIISISGVDGSGKSTQTKLLIEHLRNHGQTVFYFHAIDFSLANKIANLKKYCLLCRLSGKCSAKKKNDDFQKSVVKASGFQIWLRKIFFRIDLWRFKKLLRKIQKQDYDYLISDRYFLDSIVNVEYLSHQKFNFYLPIEMKPDKAFYLSVLPENILKRERVPDQGLQYLVDKQDIFDKKIDDWKMIFVNGNGSVDEIFEEILSKL